MVPCPYGSPHHFTPSGMPTQTSLETLSKVLSLQATQSLWMLQFRMLQSLPRLPLSILRKPSRRWQYSTRILSSRLKSVIPNPQANEKCEDHFDTYNRRHELQPYPSYSYVSSWYDQLLLSPTYASKPRSGSFAWGQVQGFLSKGSEWLKGFCIYHLELYQTRLPGLASGSLQLGVSLRASLIHRV